MKRSMIVLLSFIVSSTSAAQTKRADSLSFEFRPTVLDARNGAGAVLGVEYELKGERARKWERAMPGPGIDPDVVFGTWGFDYSANGTATVAAETNPRSFLEAAVALRGTRSSPSVDLLGGLEVKYEADQKFVDKQSVVGFTGTVGKSVKWFGTDFVALDVGFGRVDPTGHEEREVAVGAGNLEPYYRVELEFFLQIPLKGANLTDLEMNYRGFFELDAPAAVTAAELNRYELGSVRLGLKNDLFLAYSVGKLPFDRATDNVLAIGFSHKLK